MNRAARRRAIASGRRQHDPRAELAVFRDGAAIVLTLTVAGKASRVELGAEGASRVAERLYRLASELRAGERAELVTATLAESDRLELGQPCAARAPLVTETPAKGET